MENSYELHSNGNLTDLGLSNVRHPHQSSGRFSLPWFDIRVFYVRISNFTVDDSTPESLTLKHIPLSPDTVLEVNGVRCLMDSEGISCILRRDLMDKKSEEAKFVSTDSIRLTGSVKFEVFNKEDLVISGVLEMSITNGFIGESNNFDEKWSLNCESVISTGVGFLKGKHIMGSESSSLTIEVYVADCFSGTPIILTKTLQLNHRMKHRKDILESIPEYGTSESHEDVASEHDLQYSYPSTMAVACFLLRNMFLCNKSPISIGIECSATSRNLSFTCDGAWAEAHIIIEFAKYKDYKPESEEEDYDSLYWRQTEYIEGEDGELSWFNAGVRVGVGLGLGICLGIGIGVGLLVRTYQITTRVVKRRLL